MDQSQVAYEQQDYYHSLQWLEESSSLKSLLESLLESPLKSSLKSPLESPLKSPLESSLGSPLESPLKSPLKFFLKSPLESPLESPLKFLLRHFLDNSRYILFAYMLINDTLQLLSSVILFLLVIGLVTFPTVYCVPLLLLSTSTFMNTTLILATMSLERYVAIIYPLQCPAAWRSDRIWIIILSICWSLLTVAVIPVSLGEMYTSLLNVEQAISVERKLIDYLKTYIDHESERLEDVKRWSLLTVAVIPVSLGEMYTSLLNVKQAISVERKLIDYLKTYIDHESERLEDVKR
ncbi:hypothetical protein NQZ68_012888 [Dissostichus eleginoides]|nr:hypothetical protein NQZ68_012888 [Dissostichus eleginoides]